MIGRERRDGPGLVCVLGVERVLDQRRRLFLHQYDHRRRCCCRLGYGHGYRGEEVVLGFQAEWRWWWWRRREQRQ